MRMGSLQSSDKHAAARLLRFIISRYSATLSIMLESQGFFRPVGPGRPAADEF